MDNISWADIKAGVPQGSILGLLPFLQHINDLMENIPSDPERFAGGTSSFSTVTMQLFQTLI